MSPQPLPRRWRDEHGDRCQWPTCRRSGDVHYLTGATPFNRERSVWLCEEHLHELHEHLRLRASAPRQEVFA